MSRNKLQKFEYLHNSPFVIEMQDPRFESIKGNWRKDFFKNDQPITLEVGCGHGHYTVGLALKFPERNFIGMDIKGSRIWNGTKLIEEYQLKNAGFLRIQALTLPKFFEANEVDEIWLTFPDPRPRDSDEKRRLFSPRLLDVYRQFLKKGGKLHLKTDNHPLYAFALEVAQEQKLEIQAATDDLYQSEFLADCHDIQTTYEKRFLSEGMKINYLRVEPH